MTALLLVYAIIVIASSVFWVWSALSKATPTMGGNQVDTHHAIEPSKRKQDIEATADKGTELTVGTKERIEADGQANDSVKSNDF